MPQNLTNNMTKEVNIGLGYGQQAIIEAKADPHLWRRMASLGHNELIGMEIQ